MGRTPLLAWVVHALACLRAGQKVWRAALACLSLQGLSVFVVEGHLAHTTLTHHLVYLPDMLRVHACSASGSARPAGFKWAGQFLPHCPFLFPVRVWMSLALSLAVHNPAVFQAAISASAGFCVSPPAASAASPKLFMMHGSSDGMFPVLHATSQTVSPYESIDESTVLIV